MEERATGAVALAAEAYVMGFAVGIAELERGTSTARGIQVLAFRQHVPGSAQHVGVDRAVGYCAENKRHADEKSRHVIPLFVRSGREICIGRAARLAADETVIRRAPDGEIRQGGFALEESQALEATLQKHQVLRAEKHVIEGKPDRPEGSRRPTMAAARGRLELARDIEIDG